MGCPLPFTDTPTCQDFQGGFPGLAQCTTHHAVAGFSMREGGRALLELQAAKATDTKMGDALPAILTAEHSVST